MNSLLAKKTMRYEYGSANGTYSTAEILNFFVSVTSTQLTDHGVASWSIDPDETIELEVTIG